VTAGSQALVRSSVDALADDVRLQQIWLAANARSWRSLAIVAASANVSTIDTANVLAKIAWLYSGEPTSVFDLRGVSLRLVEHQVNDIQARVSLGDRVFIALRSATEDPTAVPIARAADAAVLCLMLGQTDGQSALTTVNAIGRDRFLGSILVPQPRP
jgi:hypothetical protein